MGTFDNRSIRSGHLRLIIRLAELDEIDVEAQLEVDEGAAAEVGRWTRAIERLIDRNLTMGGPSDPKEFVGACEMGITLDRERREKAKL